jgi:anti-sigma B factor antagonist
VHVLTPPVPEFHLEVRPQRSRAVIGVEGEVDCATAPRVAEAVDQLRAVGWDAIAIDVGGVSFIESAGLRLLLTVDARARDEGWRFDVEGTCAPLERVLSLTGLTDRFGTG